MIEKINKIKLDLFAGEGGGDGAGAAQNSAANTPAASGGEVVYGKQTPSAEATNVAVADGSVAGNENASSSTLDDKRKSYQDLVNGEYKEQYTEDIQRIINRRFKDVKGMEEQLTAQQSLIDTLASRYGETDLTKLAKAIDEDSAFWAQAAEDAGMTVEQYKKVRQLEKDNAELLKHEQQRQTDTRVQQQMAKWASEEQVLQQKFKGFSLQKEIQNPQFMELLKTGLPMEHAYKVIHMDEILADAVGTTAASVENAVVNNIRAKGSRPTENGSSPQSAFIVKDDVTKLSRKDRAEIARRVARGEKITF